MMVEAVRAFEMPAYFNVTTRSYIPGSCHLLNSKFANLIPSEFTMEKKDRRWLMNQQTVLLRAIINTTYLSFNRLMKDKHIHCKWKRKIRSSKL
jgi:hypothetical protein